MLDKHERQKQELLIFGIVCGICAIFLALMITIAYFDLIVVRSADYQNQAVELSNCQRDNKILENDLRKNVREDWEDIEG